MYLAEAPVASPRPTSTEVAYVSPSQQALLALPATAACVPVARRWAAVLLNYWGVLPDDEGSALLVIDELAANAALHGRADMTLLLCLDGRTLRITVADSGAPTSCVRAGIDADDYGRGCELVRLLSECMAVQRTAQGWIVQAVVRCW
nr:ATP-binding protein [Streptomyces sp. NBC_00886]WSY57516.1 ATP-binding protein [Streptomyces sp. NBC_00886]